MYDFKCCTCDRVEERLEKMGTREVPCSCGGTMDHVWLPGTGANVVGDEIDIWIKHGICHENGEPRHYTSKEEMRRVAKEKGLVNRVEHVGTRGSDKSRHTTRWI